MVCRNVKVYPSNRRLCKAPNENEQPQKQLSNQRLGRSCSGVTLGNTTDSHNPKEDYIHGAPVPDRLGSSAVVSGPSIPNWARASTCRVCVSSGFASGCERDSLDLIVVGRGAGLEYVSPRG